MTAFLVWFVVHIEDLTLGVFVGATLALNWLLSRYRNDYYQAMRKAMEREIQRDQLAHWLQVNGWLVDFQEDRTVITRDPER